MFLWEEALCLVWSIWTDCCWLMCVLCKEGEKVRERVEKKRSEIRALEPQVGGNGTSLKGPFICNIF